jgi:glycosyltransferase involved in cell wall biosynthesis
MLDRGSIPARHGSRARACGASTEPRRAGGRVSSLSVVVPCRDRADLLDPCLAALRSSLGADDELIVVDSASNGVEVARTAQRHGARVLRSGWPGTSRARNIGARAASREVVAFVDDDVRVDREWADAMRACFAAHPDVAFATGRIAVPTDQRHAHRPVAIADAADALEFRDVATAVFGHGANVAVRATALAEVGGFDESFGPGARFKAAEDHELFDRLLAAGFHGRFEPAASAEHEQWRQRWSLVALEWGYGMGTGARLAGLCRRVPLLARRVAADTLWRDGVRTVPASIRNGHELNVAFVAARVVATATGFVAASLRQAG